MALTDHAGHTTGALVRPRRSRRRETVQSDGLRQWVRPGEYEIVQRGDGRVDVALYGGLFATHDVKVPTGTAADRLAARLIAAQSGR